jgi:hypothetical protein
MIRPEAHMRITRVAADWNRNSRIRLMNMIKAIKGPNRVLFSWILFNCKIQMNNT